MKINMPNNWNRKLHRLWKKLEPELASLDFAAKEFVCQACSAGGRLSTVQKAFRNARTRAGMPGLHFHDLRHTFASRWMMNGGDLYVLKEILGHKSITMTQRYAHLAPHAFDSDYDRFNALAPVEVGKIIPLSATQQTS